MHEGAAAEDDEEQAAREQPPLDVAELVAPHIHGFDLEVETQKVAGFGALAFSARKPSHQLPSVQERGLPA